LLQKNLPHEVMILAVQSLVMRADNPRKSADAPVRDTIINCGHSIRDAVFTHSQRNDHTLDRPIKSDSAAEPGGHTSVHQLASKTFQLCGSEDRRATPFGPHNHHFVLVGVARYIQGAT
jgi:hypothetical protein